MKQTVTGEYLSGIKEGREYLKRFGKQSADEIRAHIRNLDACLARGFAKPMADGFRGERDFWSNQLKGEIK